MVLDLLEEIPGLQLQLGDGADRSPAQRAAANCSPPGLRTGPVVGACFVDGLLRAISTQQGEHFLRFRQVELAGHGAHVELKNTDWQHLPNRAGVAIAYRAGASATRSANLGSNWTIRS